jgi:HK97 family phage portal protein
VSDWTWQDGGRYWHVPGRHIRAGSPYGLSPAAYAGDTIGLGIAARDFSNQFFTQGHPTWGFFSESELTEAQAKAIKGAVMTALTPGNREPLVMGSGLDAKQFSPQPGETQFIDLMRFINEEAARVWRVPPSAIAAAMSGQSVTYASVGDEDLRKLKDTLDGYFVRIESGLTACLPQPQVVKFNRNAILRADPKTRNEIYDVRLKNKTMTVNEVRRLEDETPFADPMYDDPGIPGAPIMPSGSINQGTPA